MRYTPFPDFATWRVPFDAESSHSAVRAIEEAKDRFGDESLRRGVEIATRSAAVETGAIEGLYETTRGFTATIAEMAEGWESALQRRGSDVERHVRDAFAGFDYVLDAVTGERPVSAHWLRELHAIIAASQSEYEVVSLVGDEFVRGRRPLPHGEYKVAPNNPTRLDGTQFHYCPPERVAGEMDRLVRELASEEFLQAASVLQAAYAHYSFILIHPFADGNGRVARALASVYLYRSPGVPLVIFSDQRDAYLDALEAADDGRAEPFVGFIEARMIDAVQLVTAATQTSDAMGELAAALTEPVGQGLPDMDLLRRSLELRTREALQAAVARDWPAGVLARVDESRTAGLFTPADVELNSGFGTLDLELEAEVAGAPVAARSTVVLHPFLVQTSSGAYGVSAHAAGIVRDETVRFDKGELFPRITDHASARLEIWARTVVDQLAAALAEKIRAARAMGEQQ